MTGKRVRIDMIGKTFGHLTCIGSSLSAGAATQAAAIQTGMATAELVDDLRAKHRVVDTIIIGNMQRQLRKQEQEIKRMLAANEEKKMAQIPLIPLE